MSGDARSEGTVSAPRKFLVETLTGIAIFSIIAGAAVGLSFFVKFLETNNVDVVVIVGLKIAEYAIFVVDLILFGRFLWRTFTTTWSEL